MKKLFILCCFYTSFFSFAQQGTISGTILDFNTKQPLNYVNIVCKDAAQKILTGSITNEKGVFLITKLPLQNISIEIQFIGYKTIFKKGNLSKDTTKIQLNTLYLKETTTNLEEVEVQAETTTIVQKIDRRVVNVGKDLASAGTNALDMMQNIPSVSVDLLSGTISLRGNENVRVLVDGKPSNLSTSQLLKQLPSSSIKSVELITNPSAKYNPEGMSGIINIILKKKYSTWF